MFQEFGRRLSRWPTTGIQYKKTINHKIRDMVDSISQRLKPIIRILFPNFIVVHYAYIIGITLFTSFLLYPCHNAAYIDILFTSAGAATQGGLNTISTNDYTLYQQIVVYIMCCLATPIFIHGSLAFVRLYWFERYFDNIKYTSRQDFLRRRTMTLQNLQTRTNTTRTQRDDEYTPISRRNSNFQENLFSLKMISRDTDMNNGYNANLQNNNKPKKETFRQRHQSEDVSPEDMYRSIHLLQNQSEQNRINEGQNSSDHDNNDSEQTYIVKGPNEQESSGSHQSNYNQVSNLEITNPISTSPRSSQSRSYLESGYVTEDSYSDMTSENQCSSNNATSQTPTSESSGEIPKQASESDNENNSNNDKPNGLQFEIVHPPRKQKLINDKKRKEKRRQKKLKSFTRILSMPPSMRMEYVKNKKLKSSLSNVDPLENNPEGRNLRRRNTTNQHSNKRKRQGGWNTNMFNSNGAGIDKLTTNPDLEDNYYLDEENNFPQTNTMMSANYVSWEPTYGRNSVFTGLTKEQRNELGGVEYRAIKLLCFILLAYYIGWHVCSIVMLIPWICLKPYYNNLLKSQYINPVWWAIFTSMSSFNDLGLTLTADSMVPFQNAIYILIVLMWFIVIGNTGFPILLRFIIWILFKLSPELSPLKETSGFLLDHPRRCFTLLFPHAATWWLLLTLLVLNGTDWILYIILDFSSPPISEMPKGVAVLAGLFQSICTRTPGFNVVDIAALHPSIQVSYMLMMYVSVLPLAISIRRTNVYEEQSLGIYGSVRDLEDLEEEAEKEDSSDDEKEEPDGTLKHRGSSTSADTHLSDSNNNSKDSNEKDAQKETKKKKRLSAKSFIGAHLRRQLSFDLWYLFLGLFIVCVCESGKIQDLDNPAMNVFAILFEIVSAYGTVGMSLGYPGTSTSLSAQFTPISKLVIIAMLIRGRNRGLPYSLDRAIILPTKKLQQIDRMEDLRNKHRLNRTHQESHLSGDAMNNYVKKKYSEVKHGFRTIQRTATMAPIDENRAHTVY